MDLDKNFVFHIFFNDLRENIGTRKKKTFLAASLSSMNIFSSVLKAEPFKY